MSSCFLDFYFLILKYLHLILNVHFLSIAPVFTYAIINFSLHIFNFLFSNMFNMFFLCTNLLLFFLKLLNDQHKYQCCSSDMRICLASFQMILVSFGSGHILVVFIWFCLFLLYFYLLIFS